MKVSVVKCVRCGWSGMIPWADIPGTMYDACPVCNHDVFVKTDIKGVAEQMKPQKKRMIKIHWTCGVHGCDIYHRTKDSAERCIEKDRRRKNSEGKEKQTDGSLSGWKMKTPMEIIREHQSEFERELESKLVDVDGIVSAFVKETGVPISGIRIEFIETTTIGSQPEYHMCGVRVEYGP